VSADENEDDDDEGQSRKGGRSRRVRCRQRRAKWTAGPARLPCGVSGCKNDTTERKPFCVDHLDHLPYAKKVIGLVTRVTDELSATKARGRRAVAIDGIVAKDILAEIQQKGAVSPQSLHMRLGLNPLDTDWNAFVDALVKDGVIKKVVVGSRRGVPRTVLMLGDRPDVDRLVLEKRLAKVATAIESVEQRLAALATGSDRSRYEAEISKLMGLRDESDALELRLTRLGQPEDPEAPVVGNGGD
jgi:hypothetical protein